MISSNQQSTPSIAAALSGANAGSSASATGLPDPSAAAGSTPRQTSEKAPARDFQQHVDDGNEGRGRTQQAPARSSGNGAAQAKPQQERASRNDATGEASSGSTKSSKSSESNQSNSESSAQGAAEPQSGKKAVLAQILRQIVKQNPAGKPDALSFLEGQINDQTVGQLPQLMTSSRFISDVLVEQDLSSFMAEDLKPSAVMRELGFSPEMITQALALGIDNEGPASRGAVLAALGTEPGKIKASIDRVKVVLMRDGVTGYMQQALAIAKASGKQPALLESIVARDLDDASSDLADFKNDTSLEVQAVMAQALAASGNWSPRHMAQSGAPKLDGPAIDPTTALMAPLSTAPDQAAIPLEAPRTGDTSSSLARFESAAAPAPAADPAPAAENINVLEFAARLQADFGDDIRILDVGASAWDDSVLSQSASEVSSLASPDVRAGASLDLEIPVPEGFSAVINKTPDLAKPASRPPASDLAKDFFAVAEVRPEKNLPDADGLPSMSPVMAPLAEVPVEFKEQAAEAAPKSEPVDVAVLAASRVNVDMPVAETAEAPAADKSERIENSSRHAAETVRKIQDAVRRTAVSDIGAMRLDLSSPETGNVEIAVRVDGDQQVDVRVMAASGELRDLLARELPQLKNALGEQNLNLRDLDVRSWTSGSGQQSPSDGFARQGGQDEWREAANRLSSGISGARSAATSSIDAIKGQMGRQALRAFRILDMTERSGATGSMVSGRIKVLV